MGFGSYDEDEQRDQTGDIDEADGINVHANDHDGAVTFDTDESSADLVARLKEMRSNDAD